MYSFEEHYNIFDKNTYTQKVISGKELHQLMKTMKIGEKLDLSYAEIIRTFGGWIWTTAHPCQPKAYTSVFIPYSKEAVLA